jgi:hypothetical protein
MMALVYIAFQLLSPESERTLGEKILGDYFGNENPTVL